MRAVEDGRPLLAADLAGRTPPSCHRTSCLIGSPVSSDSRASLHPSLSQTHALIPFDEEGRTCLLREPVELEGKTLPELLRSLGRPLRETEVQDLASQIGEALDAVHRLDLRGFVAAPNCRYQRR